MKMCTVSEDTYQTLFQLAVCHVRGQTYSQNITEPNDIAIKNAALFGSILQIVEGYLRMPQNTTSIGKLSESLAEIRFPNSAIATSVTALDTVRHELLLTADNRYHHLPSLRQLRWRVDITISSSVLSRVLEPSLVFEMTLTNGKRVTFEVSVSKFHKMRFTIASLLKEMDCLDRKMNAIKL